MVVGGAAALRRGREKKRLQKLFPSLQKQFSKGFKPNEFLSKRSQDMELCGARAITHPLRGMNK
jgi:hypothetical protein